MVFTTAWVFWFDREFHDGNVVAVGVVCFSSYNIFIQTFLTAGDTTAKSTQFYALAGDVQH